MATHTRLPVIDADAHVIETERTWDYLEPSNSGSGVGMDRAAGCFYTAGLNLPPSGSATDTGAAQASSVSSSWRIAPGECKTTTRKSS